MNQKGVPLPVKIMSENQGSQTEIEEGLVLAYPRSTQTDPVKVSHHNSFIRLVDRISLSPEPVHQRPKNIFSNIRTPTYFTSAISNSLLIGASGNLMVCLERFGTNKTTST